MTLIQMRIYALHFCDLLDITGAAPSVPAISNRTHAVLFPTWVQPDCGDYTRPLVIAKKNKAM
jgi:hypothetical protein